MPKNRNTLLLSNTLYIAPRAMGAPNAAAINAAPIVLAGPAAPLLLLLLLLLPEESAEAAVPVGDAVTTEFDPGFVAVTTTVAAIEDAEA